MPTAKYYARHYPSGDVYSLEEDLWRGPMLGTGRIIGIAGPYHYPDMYDPKEHAYSSTEQDVVWASQQDFRFDGMPFPADTRQTVEKSLRYRVNVSTSVKGIKTWECTTEGTGYTMEEVLERSDALVAELERRYPNGETVKEG